MGVWGRTKVSRSFFAMECLRRKHANRLNIVEFSLRDVIFHRGIAVAINISSYGTIARHAPLKAKRRQQSNPATSYQPR